MPIALERSTWVAAAPRADRTLVVRSGDYGETVTIDLDDDPSGVVAQPFGAAPAAVCRPEGLRYERTPASPQPALWIRYVQGTAAVIGRSTRLSGADLMIVSDVPIGAGLSSSAALEVACGYALMDLAGPPVDLDVLARAAQRAEHEFVGTRCGIMDQMIACYGRAESALCLDTRSLERRWLPLPSRLRIVVCNTMVHHQLASGEYNLRRADCESGVAAFAQRDPQIRALRDVTTPELEGSADWLPERVYRRCRHVITENARVVQAAAALAEGDFNRVGALMNESHESSRQNFENSTPELDLLVSIAQDLPGVLGARLTGAGFGGATVTLCERPRAQEVAAELSTRYADATGIAARVFVSRIADGAK
jgi:galactokinase